MADPFAILSAEVDLLGTADIYFPSEDHRLPGDLTEYPVESGKNLTDNYVRMGDEVVLEGLVSDVQPGVKMGDSAVVWNRVAALRGGALVTVSTHIRTYLNMAVLEARTRRADGIKGSLVFFLKMREVLFATSRTVQLTASNVDPGGPAAHRTATVQGGTRVARTVSAPRFGLDILESPGTNVGV